MIDGASEMPTYDHKSTMVGNNGNGYAVITPIVVNKNNYLETLTTNVGTWDKQFDTTENNYVVTVDKYVHSITINASTYSDKASVTGTGTFVPIQ
jgi:hypothetical protein